MTDMLTSAATAPAADVTPQIPEAGAGPERPPRSAFAAGGPFYQVLPAWRAAAAACQPWPRTAEALCASANPLDLQGALRELRLREQIPGLELNGRPYDLWRASHVPAHDRPPGLLSAADYAKELACRFAVLVSRLSAGTARRLRHIYQVRCLPAFLEKRRAMSSYLALTFLPERLGVNFPENGLVDISDVKALTLATRRHSFRGRTVDMFDLKLHKLHIDPDTGDLHVGGAGRDVCGRPVSRCCYARHFNEVPWHGRKPRPLFVEDDSVHIIESGLAAHFEMEQIVLLDGRPAYLTLPRAYLAFRRPDDVEFERTAELKETAYREARGWLEAGKPAGWLGLGQGDTGRMLQALRKGVREECRGWPNLELQLHRADPQAAEFLLLRVWESQEIQHEGFHLIPLEFFSYKSLQQPVRKSLRQFVRFTGRALVGRRTIATHTVPEEDGLRTVGQLSDQPRAGAIQVVHYSKGNPFRGDVDARSHYDFDPVPLGWERHFVRADH